MIDKNRAARQPRSWAIPIDTKARFIRLANKSGPRQGCARKQQGPALRGPLLKLLLRLG